MNSCQFHSLQEKHNTRARVHAHWAERSGPLISSPSTRCAACSSRQPRNSRPSNGELQVATMPVPEQLCSLLPPPPPFRGVPRVWSARTHTRAMQCSDVSLRHPPRPAPAARRFGKLGEEGTTFLKLVMLPTTWSCSDSTAGRGF